MRFDEAYDYTLAHEGGYVNNPKDPGGETYKGISRKYHPDWIGWEIIDKLKAAHPTNFQAYLENEVELQQAVKNFYYYIYWLDLHCEQMPKDVALELFDTAVNLGKRRASRILQKSLNLLNRNQRLFKDLTVDGIIGPKTLTALHMVNPRRLVKVMNGYQFIHYANLMELHPEFEKYVGWFNRV